MKSKRSDLIRALLMGGFALAAGVTQAQKVKADTSFVSVHIKGAGLTRDFRESNVNGPKHCIGTYDVPYTMTRDTALKGITIGTVNVAADKAEVTLKLDHIAGPGVVPLLQQKPGEYLQAHPGAPFVAMLQVNYISQAGGQFPGSGLSEESIAVAGGDDPRNTGSVTITEYKGPGTHMKGHFAFKIWVESKYHKGLERGKPGFYDVTGDFDVVIGRAS